MINKTAILLAPDAPAGGTAVATPDKPTTEKPAEKAAADDFPGLKAFAKSHFKGNEGPIEPSKEEKPAEKPAAEKPKPEKAGEKPADKSKPAAKPKPAPAAPPQPLSEEKIAEAAARGVAKAFAEKPTEKKADAPDPVAQLPEEEKEIVAVLRVMEKMFPDRYKGKAEDYAKKYREAATKLEEYAAKWEKENPGQKFDEDAPEHADFIESNSIETEWDDTHYYRAAGRMEAEKVQEEARKHTDSKLSEIDRREKLRDAGQHIAAAQIEASKVLWKTFGEDFAAVIAEDGHVDQAKMVELQKRDPEMFALRVQSAHDLSFEVAELHKLMNNLEPVQSDRPSQSDPKYQEKYNKWLCHETMAQFCSEQEKRLAAAPPENQLNQDGKSFLPSEKFYALPKSEQSNHWTLSEADLIALRAADRASQTAKHIANEEAKLRRIAESRGWKMPEPVVNKETNPTAANPNANGELEEKPESPSSSAESRMAATKETGRNDGGNPLDYFGRKHLGIAS